MIEIDNFLRQIPIFSQLSDDKLGQISNLSLKKKFNKDSVILSEHETGSAFFIVINGKVKISRLSEDGNEVILTTLSESDFFGEMSLLDGSSRSATVTAMEDSELLIIQRNEFINLLHSDPDISIALLIELTQKLRAANIKLKSLSLKDAEGKVAIVILQLADDIGKIRQGTVEIERLPFQHDLANMAGTSRETISRTLHTFAKKGLVELDGSRLRILNYEKFKELFN
jgi:CRP/FNR family transcriptional regulator, cyclic AMP receptor protein